jgi:hypothetical protein
MREVGASASVLYWIGLRIPSKQCRVLALMWKTTKPQLPSSRVLALMWKTTKP